MQQNTYRGYYCRMIITAGAWVLGLLVAGSDSPFMPWANVVGLVIFFAASLYLSRQFRSSKERMNSKVLPGTGPKGAFFQGSRANKNRRVKVRYA